MKFLYSLLLFTGNLIHFSKSYQLDFSNMNRVAQQCNVQTFTNSRIYTQNNVLHVNMKPTDGDGLTGNSRWDDNRQRNEISVNNGHCIIRNGQSMTYKLQLRMIDKINWAVSGGAWFHTFQIKKWDTSRPVIAVGIKNSKLAIYQCNNFNEIVLGKINNYWSKWLDIKTNIRVFNTFIRVQYSVAGRTGTVKCTNGKNGQDSYVYMKLGQYRYYPNPVKSTTDTSYRNVLCY